MRFRIFYLMGIIFCILLFTSFKPKADEGIKVTITNFRSNNGYVLVSLFKEGVGYPDKPTLAFRKSKLSINNKTANIVFQDLPTGNYAIAILHDENNDQKMNKNFLGLPKEGYGFSKNVMGTFGPPAFAKASFIHSVNTMTPIFIKIKY